jgi:hypothetical protein
MVLEKLITDTPTTIEGETTTAMASAR